MMPRLNSLTVNLDTAPVTSFLLDVPYRIITTSFRLFMSKDRVITTNDWLLILIFFLIIPTGETIKTSPGLAEIEKRPSVPVIAARLEFLMAMVAASTGKLSSLSTTPEIFCWQNAKLLYNKKKENYSKGPGICSNIKLPPFHVN